MSEMEQAVSLPAHLWEALEIMSVEMGVPRDALMSQAVFTLARLNGYVVAGKANGEVAEEAPAPVSKVKAKPSAPHAKGKSKLAPAPEPEPEEDDDGNPFDGEGDEPPPDDDEDLPEEDEPADEPPVSRKGSVLTLTMAGVDPVKMTGDVLLIGRGKHCDFAIDSNRVSREHARISREGGDFIIEDLNSSNGTFVGPNKEKKIGRHKIKDGDELTFGTERVKASLKAK